MDARCDVVIVGAGMVGATLAALLGRAGLGVTVVEASVPEPAWPEGSVDLRVSALGAAAERIFVSIGAWEAMCRMGVSPYREMRVWDAAGSDGIHFDSADIGESRLGHIVENRVVQSAVLECAERLDTVRIRRPARLERLVVDADSALIELADGDRIEARLVIGADGARSRVRELAGIGTSGWPYDQRAVVGVVSTERPHRETAWQRFLPDGPLAFLPLRDGRSSIVWSTTPDHAEALLAASDEDFMESLGVAFEHRLGRVLTCGPRAAFPLHLQYARAYTAPRIALIGDAAHTIHPLAGQGANLGLLDAAALAEVVEAAAARGRDFGAHAVLRRYERWRKGDNVATMMAMDGFKRLFGSEIGAVRGIRNLGLALTDRAVPVKNLLIQYAMGLRGDVPAVARSARV